jgi:hypothetical protein
LAGEGALYVLGDDVGDALALLESVAHGDMATESENPDS